MQMNRSRYQDLTVFGVYVVVDNDVTPLFGVVDSEVDLHDDVKLEDYLLSKTNGDVSSQSMARTKQTARKTDKKGELPLQSRDGQTLATFANRRSPRFLDSDSDLERAANMFGINTRQSPAHGSSARGSPAWGTKHQPHHPVLHLDRPASHPISVHLPEVPHHGEHRAKVPLEVLAAVCQLEQSILSRGKAGVDLVKLVSYNEEPGGHLEVPLVLPYLASVLRKRTMKMTTTMMTKLISQIKATFKEVGKQCKEENNPEIQ